VAEEELTSVPGWAPSVTLEVKDSVETGEEGEEELYSQRSKLYRFRDGEWKERGLGEAKLLRHRQTGRVRFMLRQEKTMKIAANHYVIGVPPYCDPKPNADSEKCLVWMAQDCSDGELHVERLALKFGSAELAAQFKEAFLQAREANAKVKDFAELAGIGQKGDDRVASEEPHASTPKEAPASTSQGPCTEDSTVPEASGERSQPRAQGPAVVQQSSAPLGPAAAPADANPFAGVSLSSFAPEVSGGLFGASSGGFGLFGSPTVTAGGLFGSGPALAGTAAAASAPAPGAGSEGLQGPSQDEERFVAEEELTSVPGWAPSVTLEVKDSVETGEEGEEELYSQRSKLYRFRDGEWKERGLGEAKLLRHRQTGRVRFVLRQEKTMKITANHYVIDVPPYCDLQPNAGSEKCWVWTAQDFSDGELQVEQFALKFGTPELATKFQTAFEQAKRPAAPQASEAESVDEATAWDYCGEAASGLEALAQQQAEGGWRCSACRLQWNEEVVECGVCEIPRPGAEAAAAEARAKKASGLQSAANAFLGTGGFSAAAPRATGIVVPPPPKAGAQPPGSPQFGVMAGQATPVQAPLFGAQAAPPGAAPLIGATSCGAQAAPPCAAPVFGAPGSIFGAAGVGASPTTAPFFGSMSPAVPACPAGPAGFAGAVGTLPGPEAAQAGLAPAPSPPPPSAVACHPGATQGPPLATPGPDPALLMAIEAAVAAALARVGMANGALQPAGAGAPHAAVRAIEERARGLEGGLREQEERCSRAEERARKAEERARRAEESSEAALRTVEERARRLEEGLRDQEERCSRAEERAKKAEERARLAEEAQKEALRATEERAKRLEEGLRTQEERCSRSEERARKAEESVRRAEEEMADMTKHLSQFRRRHQEQEEVLQQFQRQQRDDRQLAESLERDLAQERSARRSMEAKAAEALQVAESAQQDARQLRHERDAEEAAGRAVRERLEARAGSCQVDSLRAMPLLGTATYLQGLRTLQVGRPPHAGVENGRTSALELKDAVAPAAHSEPQQLLRRIP